jgi:hypothetical protein
MITMFRFIRLEPCGVPEAVIQDDPTRSLQAKRHGTGLGANLCYEPRLRVSLITFSRARLRDCCRPRARVLSVVWAWDLVIIRLHCCGLPAPARRQLVALRFVTVCH